MAQLVADQERDLRAGAYHQASRRSPASRGSRASPGARAAPAAVRQAARGPPRRATLGCGEPAVDVADLGVHLGDHVAGRAGDPGSAPLSPCTSGAPGDRAASGSNTAGSSSYPTVTARQPFSATAEAVGDDRGDPLPHEAHAVVEHPGVVGVVDAQFVPRGRVRHRRAVAVGQHQLHARRCRGGGGVDRHDPRVRRGLRSTARCSRPGRREVQRVPLGPGDHPPPAGAPMTARVGRRRLLDVTCPTARR